MKGVGIGKGGVGTEKWKLVQQVVMFNERGNVEHIRLDRQV